MPQVSAKLSHLQNWGGRSYLTHVFSHANMRLFQSISIMVHLWKFVHAKFSGQSLNHAGKKLSSGSRRTVFDSTNQNSFNMQFVLYFLIVRPPGLCYLIASWCWCASHIRSLHKYIPAKSKYN